MNTPSRPPPRFVPTLTDVVDAPEQQSLVSTPLPSPILAAKVRNEQARQVASDEDSPPPTSRMQAVEVSDEEMFHIEEELLHRVLQRVDLSLDARLTAAVSQAVQTQLDIMLPQLRSEIETVLRTLVIEALAMEISENTGSSTTF